MLAYPAAGSCRAAARADNGPLSPVCWKKAKTSRERACRPGRAATSWSASVADVDLIVRQALDGEVFAELSIRESGASELRLPVAVRLDLVHENRAMLAAMRGQIALRVAGDVQALHQATAGNGILPHR